MSVIVYHNPGLHVVWPHLASGLSIEEIAAKDVPQGVSWEIAPDRPSRDHDWQGGDWVYVAPATVPVEKVTRTQFCLAVKDYALLSPQDAITAAAGGWPAAFTAALSAMPGVDATDAQIVWAAAQEIHRNHPIIIALQSYLQWTPGQMDDFFTDASNK